MTKYVKVTVQHGTPIATDTYYGPLFTDEDVSEFFERVQKAKNESQFSSTISLEITEYPPGKWSYVSPQLFRGFGACSGASNKD